jgi:hypothetical protein
VYGAVLGLTYPLRLARRGSRQRRASAQGAPTPAGVSP